MAFISISPRNKVTMCFPLQRMQLHCEEFFGISIGIFLAVLGLRRLRVEIFCFIR